MTQAGVKMEIPVLDKEIFDYKPVENARWVTLLSGVIYSTNTPPTTPLPTTPPPTTPVRPLGQVTAWGTEQSGELGDGGMPDTLGSPPVLVGAGSEIITVSAGQTHSLALRADGTVLAWGRDLSGQPCFRARPIRSSAEQLAPGRVANIEGRTS